MRGSGVRRGELSRTAPEQDTSTKGFAQYSSLTNCSTGVQARASRVGSVPGYKQRGAPGHKPSLGDITAHPLVTTEPVTWGLKDIRTHHSRTSQQATLAHDARPGTTAAPEHAPGVTTTHSVPSPLALGSASVFPARHRGFGCVFPGPRQVALAGAESPGTYGKRFAG